MRNTILVKEILAEEVHLLVAEKETRTHINKTLSVHFACAHSGHDCMPFSSN